MLDALQVGPPHWGPEEGSLIKQPEAAQMGILWTPKEIFAAYGEIAYELPVAQAFRCW